MDHLSHAIASGVLVLSCPTCGRAGFQESGLGCGLLHCEHCFNHTPTLDWVKKIIRTGDDDPYVHLCIECTEAGIQAQVNTEVRELGETEALRFCSGSGGVRSVNTMRFLSTVALRAGNRRPGLRLHGNGGDLKVYQARDGDMWLKTENIEAEVFHGAGPVLFPVGIETTFFQGLISAILEDLKVRPIEFLRKKA
ncbi:MAG: hypothetical protein ACAH17_01085 [Candidatus Paceibacterota bacterium]